MLRVAKHLGDGSLLSGWHRHFWSRTV